MKTLSDISLHPKDRQAIAAAVSLLKAQFPVQSVTLFGSKATGQDDAESDIDLLVLTTRTLSWRERDAVTDALFDVELAHDVVISTLVLPTEEWEGGPYQVLPIRAEIERQGVAA
ncbi:MAG: nucleotidyltransferase domain-containing protein [Deferrisomatales bacterium]